VDGFNFASYRSKLNPITRPEHWLRYGLDDRRLSFDSHRQQKYLS